MRVTSSNGATTPNLVGSADPEQAIGTYLELDLGVSEVYVVGLRHCSVSGFLRRSILVGQGDIYSV